MAHLSFKSYKGFGTEVLQSYGFSQSVKVGNQVYISGQGGWVTKEPKEFRSTQEEQIDQAFRNIDVALRDAGATFENVFKVHSYHLPINEEALNQMKINFAKWMPNHHPLWTALAVPALGLPEMRVEIENAFYLCRYKGKKTVLIYKKFNLDENSGDVAFMRRAGSDRLLLPQRGFLAFSPMAMISLNPY